MSEYLTTKEAVDYLLRHGLKTSVSTLYQRKHWGAKHPACSKIGKTTVYKPEALDAFIEVRKAGKRGINE
jgi:hypothetical protein